MKISQWKEIYKMARSNEWKLSRFIDKDQNGQIDVWLFVFGPWEIVDIRKKAFGGHILHDNPLDRKGAPDDGFAWILKDEKLDDFLIHMWKVLRRRDRFGRLSDVRMAQDIRRRVHEGCSYPFNHPKSPIRS